MNISLACSFSCFRTRLFCAGRIWKTILAAAALATSLICGPRALAADYAAVLFAGDYPGPPAFDDHLSLSRAAFAANLATWPNWIQGPGGNIIELAGNTTGQQFLDAITPYTAGGANALGKGDTFLLFYFGHGTFSANDGLGNPASERYPAYNIWEEGLYFPDGSVVSDNALTAKFKSFAPGVYKVFVNISCYSGGFWNGNNPGGIGDLEQVPSTLLLASSIEPLSTMTGNLPPRPWEPLYLRNLIFNLNRNGRLNMTFAQWHYRSYVPGTVTGFRFDDPQEPAYYAIEQTVDQEESLVTDDPGIEDDIATGPSATLSIAYNPTNGTVTISWPFQFTGALLQQSASLVPANWLPIPATTNTNSLVVTPSAMANFYRLSLASFGAADLQLTKIGTPNPVNISNLLTYTMTVTNAGNLPATNVTLVDVLPENLVFVSSTSSQGTVSNSDNSIDAAVGTLGPGQSATITLVVQPTTTGVVSNSAEVVSDSYENIWSNNHATATNTVTGTAAQYVTTSTAGANGTVAPIGAVTNFAGQRQFFNASPNSGYWPDTWFVDGLPMQTGGSFFTLSNILASHTVLITFRTHQYVVEVTPATNGTITPTGVSGEVFVDPGTNQTFNAVPNANYSIGSWLLDGAVAQIGGSSYTISNIQTNHSVQVIFNSSTNSSQFRLNNSSGPNGTVNPSGASLVNPGTYETIAATPSPAYMVALWYLNGLPIQTNGSSFTLTNIQADASVFVTFQSTNTNQPPVTNSPIGGMPPIQVNPIPGSPSAGGISPTQGNLTDTYQGPIVRSGSGSTCACSASSAASGAALNFNLTYNSYNADGSHAQLDASVGYGWTHSFNIFLFNQGTTNMFRYDSRGGVIKYTQQGGGSTYVSDPGFFETLSSNVSGSFTLTNKENTVWTFTNVPGTPFTTGGTIYRLVQITDRNQNTTTLNYSGGNLVSITNTYGQSLSLGYNGSGHVTGVTDPLSRTTTFQYDGGSNLTSITDPLGKSVTYVYDPIHQITQKTDKDGRVFTYTYQGGEPVGISDGNAQTIYSLTNTANWATYSTSLSNDQSRVYVPATTTKTDGRGNLWTYSYDTNGCLTSTSTPDGATITYIYNPAVVLPSQVTDANGNPTTYQYDPLGNRTNVTDAMGNVTSYSYDPVFSQVTNTIDANGRTNIYQLDSRGNRTNAIDPLGQTTRYTYDGNGNILTQTDKRGNTTTYQYDPLGRQTNTTDALGNVTQMTYDSVGNVQSRTDANNHTTSYTYDGLDRLIIQTDPVGATTTTTYDGSGNRTSVTDRDTNVTSYVYDNRQRQVQMIDPLNQTTSYTYDGNDNRITTTDRNQHTTTYNYDVQNRLSATIDALGETTTTLYDPVGNVLTNLDARGYATFYTYDALNRRTTRTDPVTNSLGAPAVTSYDYAMAGAPCCSPTLGSSLLTEMVDPEGKVTYYTYDALDRRVMEIRKVGSTNDVVTTNDAVTSYTYDPNNNRTFVTNPVGNVTSYMYDAINRQTNTINPAGDITTTVYDGVGNVVTNIMPNGNVIVNTYDALDRLINVSDSIGQVAAYTYDNEGNKLTVSDGNGNTTMNSYDDLYRLTDVTDPLGETTYYQYDAEGNRTNAEDRNNNFTTYLYDAVNRRTNIIDSIGYTNTTIYDAAGNVQSLIDANGNATTYQYDGLNHRVSETYPDGFTRTFSYDGVGDLSYRTDQNGITTTYQYDDLHRLTNRAYSNLGPIGDTFSYDLSGRMLSESSSFYGYGNTFAYDGADRLTNDTSQVSGKIVSFYYNIPARIRITTYPGGRVVTNTTDFRSRVSRFDDSASSTPVALYSYDLANRILSRSYRGGAVSTYTYNANNWTTNVLHQSGANLIAGFNYAYDNEGNKLYEQNLQASNTSQAYRYDDDYRLIDFASGTLSGGSIPSASSVESWTLDPLGNWSGFVSNYVAQTRTHSAANELLSINGAPLYYDHNGNLTNDGIYLYAYDGENRLYEILSASGSNSLVLSNYYDALGRRIAKQTATNNLLYYYDAVQIIEQLDEYANDSTFVYGMGIDEVLAMNNSTNTYYFYQDALGSVVAASANNATNAIERYSYNAYGNTRITDGTGVIVSTNASGTPHSVIGLPYLFTGRQIDEENGLYFYRARYYDPVKGRFLQRDVLEYVDGMNLYQYVQSNPINRTDSSGLDTDPVANNLGVTSSDSTQPPNRVATYLWQNSTEQQLIYLIYKMGLRKQQAIKDTVAALNAEEEAKLWFADLKKLSVCEREAALNGNNPYKGTSTRYQLKPFTVRFGFWAGGGSRKSEVLVDTSNNNVVFALGSDAGKPAGWKYHTTEWVYLISQGEYTDE